MSARGAANVPRRPIGSLRVSSRSSEVAFGDHVRRGLLCADLLTKLAEAAGRLDRRIPQGRPPGSSDIIVKLSGGMSRSHATPYARPTR